MKQTVMLFATGFEEVEALMTVDILRRGGVDVKLASITGDMTVCGSHSIQVGMDTTLAQVDMKQMDAVLIPGGMPGTRNLGKDDAVFRKPQVPTAPHISHLQAFPHRSYQ